MSDKPLKFVEHEIADNVVITNKKPDKTNKITELIGATKVTVGVNDPSKKVIKVDPDTGLNYLDNETYAQQIFNISTQCRGCWFALDLETGRNGQSWYPGSKQIADTIEGIDVDIKKEASDESLTIITIANQQNILIIDTTVNRTTGVIWYKVKYESYEGYYIKDGNLTNFRYVDRES